MDTKTPPTTFELRAAFVRSGLWRMGWDFRKAMAVPVVVWALQKSALAGRRKVSGPVQLSLI